MDSESLEKISLVQFSSDNSNPKITSSLPDVSSTKHSSINETALYSSGQFVNKNNYFLKQDKKLNKQRLINAISLSHLKSKSKNNHHYQKLNNSPLINTDTVNYGSINQKQDDLFQQVETTKTDLTPAIKHQIQQFEIEKERHLLGFKMILIIVLSFCIVVCISYVPIVYLNLTDTKLAPFKEETFTYWRVVWLVNCALTLTILTIGIIGILKEKVVLILIAAVSMMLSLLESENTLPNNKIFSIPLWVISFTSVLMIIYAAKLRCYAEEKIIMINKIQYM